MRLADDGVQVHVLDIGLDIEHPLRRLECCIAALYGIDLRPMADDR